MITVKQKVDLIEATFGLPKISSSGKNATVFCPVCESNGKSNKLKLSISLDTGVYHCWVCESKGKNIGRLALKYCKQRDAAARLYSIFRSDEDSESEEEIEEKVRLPEDFKLLANCRKSDHQARLSLSYLKSRGFTYVDLWRFKAGISDEFGFKNRVIFPSFDEEQNLNYYISRTIEKDNKYRYNNCKKQRKDVIFNEFDIDFSKELILTEGVFDLINCPENSTCCLGSWLDKNYLLFQKIVRNRTPVVLCFDPDAMMKTQKIAKSLSEFCVDVRVSMHKGKDFGDMTKEEVNYWISEAKPFDNVERVTYLINDITSGSMF